MNLETLIAGEGLMFSSIVLLGVGVLFILWLILAQGAFDFVRGVQSVQGHIHAALLLRLVRYNRCLNPLLRRLRSRRRFWDRVRYRSICHGLRLLYWVFFFGVHDCFECAGDDLPPNAPDHPCRTKKAQP